MAATLLTLIACSPAQGQPSFLPRGVLVLYSDFCIHPESGDVLGTRVGLIRLVDDTYAFYQESEGWPGQPVAVKLDGDHLNRGIVKFAVTENGRDWQVEGTVTPEAILLTSGGNRDGLKDTDKVLRLPKVSPERGLSDCK